MNDEGKDERPIDALMGEGDMLEFRRMGEEVRGGAQPSEKVLMRLLDEVAAERDALRAACREAHRFVCVLEHPKAEALERVLWNALSPERRQGE